MAKNASFELHPFIILALRLILGVYFLTEGIAYIGNTEAYANLFINYDLAPHTLAPVFALTIPWLNLAMGLMLLFGYHTRFASFLSGMALLGATAGIIANTIRGADMTTGAFALFGAGESMGILAAARSFAFLLLTLPLFFDQKRFLTLDAIFARVRRKEVA